MRDGGVGADSGGRLTGSAQWGLAALGAVVVAVLTLLISSAVPATYRASTQVRITVNGGNGLGQDSVLAGNQLTAQLVQLVPTDAILALPATQLGMSVTDLRNALSVGSVAQQNLLEVNATGSSQAQARRRATAATQALLSFGFRGQMRPGIEEEVDPFARTDVAGE